MLAPALMVQGTASSVGKSVIAAGLCRLFAQRGLRVLPFKAQNMSLNAAITGEGLEIGRAQAVQAEAAGVPASVDMNPILLKPEAGGRCQLVLRGRSQGSLAPGELEARKPELRAVIADALDRLQRSCDLLVIEGAGSPAEVNLKADEIVNMHVARAADAPVLLVGDIDRGGVFAALLGTVEILDPDERARVAAFVVNRFRGDRAQLQPGLDWLVQRTGIPVMGVVPHLPGLAIADEDALDLESRRRRRRTAGALDVAIVRWPHISNFDEFAPLEAEPGVGVRFVERAEELAGADLVILPGTKSVVADLTWARRTGVADLLLARARAAQPVLGICGGCEMMGEALDDPEGVESKLPFCPGLGLLPLRTRFAAGKITATSRARPAGASFLTADLPPEAIVAGYEIHAGQVEPAPGIVDHAFRLVERNGVPMAAGDGAVSRDGLVVGTMLHGLFADDRLRAGVLAWLRKRGALPAAGAGTTRADGLDELAEALKTSLDLPLLYRLGRV